MTNSSIRRAFFDLSDEEVELAERMTMARWYGFGKVCDWDDLLQSRLILLLSEAQSGKTFECQARRDAMWAAGEAAFYVELASVASQPWRELQTPEETERLEVWRRTESDVATVFLDSLDELKLTQGRFQTALRNVANELHGHMGRVRVILTTRPLPVDRELFLKTFAAPKAANALDEDDFASVALGKKVETDTKDKASEVRCVSLLPLSAEDVAKLAAERGVADTDAFLQGLRNASMMEFMRRPQDVIEAAAAWIDLRGSFGTHAQQVAFDISARLKANPDRGDRPLEGDRALDGAKRLALAVVLTQRLTIRHDVNNDSGDPATVVDPALILYDWHDEDRRALLERGLFGFASYGRVRFHNRLAFEFLAARRLSDLVDAGMSRKAVIRLLVVQTAQGFDVIRPSLQDVAAWLALWQPWVFEDMKELDPALLMNLGDPGSLTVEQRGKVLTAFIERFGKGGWRGLSVPQVQIHRLADPALAGIVRAEFDVVENPEVKQILLDLIAQARLASCADIARKVVWGEGVEYYVRSDALDALIALGDSDLVAVAERAAVDPGLWDQRFRRAIVYRLFPRWMSVEQLLTVLVSLEETRSTGDELSRILPGLIEGMDREGLEALRIGLLPLVEEGYVFNVDLHVAQTARPHLVHMLAAVCASLMESRLLAPDHCQPVALAAELARGMRSDEGIPSRLFNAIAAAPAAVRKAIFEQVIAMTRTGRPERPRLDLFMELARRGALTWTVADDTWVRALLADRDASADARAAALLVELYALSQEAEDRQAHLEGLRPLVADDAELASYLEVRLAPQHPTKDFRRWAICDQRRRRQRERRDAKDKASWVIFWRELKDDPEAAFSPGRVENTAWNLHRVMQKGGARSRSSSWDRQLIEDHLGKDVADRLRTALIPTWRKETVPLASERPDGESSMFYERWVLGLAAISAEAEDADWAKRLTPEEAEKAVRYAPWNFSNFPAWLDALAAEHADVVERLLGSQLSGILNSKATEHGRSIMLQDIDHATPELARLFLPRMRTWLEATGGLPREGEHLAGAAARLDQVIGILLKHSDEADRALVRDLASAALARGSNEPFSRVWLPTLFAVDPEAAVVRLEALCQGIEVSRESRAVAWVAELFGGLRRGSGVGLRNPAMTPDLLLRLLRLAYRHVERGEDAVHEGSYSPDMRDDAETGRNMLLNAVMELGGAEGWTAKQTIAADPDFAHLRDRLHALAVQKASQEADGLAMRPEEVVKLDSRDEPGPRTPAEMFALMRDRLDDLADHLLGDASPREMWAGVRDERVMRRAIAEHLAGHACGAYSIAQEGVTADEKETDIRFVSPINGVEGVVELKVGDKDYSAAELRGVISDQLVGKYLAPEGRRAGILLVTRAEREGWQHPDTGARLDFDGLIEMLREAARDVQESFPDEIHIDVVGLDLKPRLGTERAARAAKRAAAGAGPDAIE